MSLDGTSGEPGEPIAAELTAGGGVVGRAAQTHVHVLAALVAAVRRQLLAPMAAAAAAPAAPGVTPGDVAAAGGVFAVPPASALKPPFPRDVKTEDPVYFRALADAAAEQRRRDDPAVTQLQHAYAASDDRLYYAFDRRYPTARTRTGGAGPKSAKSGSSSPARAGPLGVGGGGHCPQSAPTAAEDGATATLRWAAQQRLAAEHRAARCEHVLELLSAEIEAEAEREGRLRRCARGVDAARATDAAHPHAGACRVSS
jgi:hypothetical protein